MQHILKMHLTSLLPKYIKGTSKSGFACGTICECSLFKGEYKQFN
jgi:hypothetical protein